MISALVKPYFHGKYIHWSLGNALEIPLHGFDMSLKPQDVVSVDAVGAAAPAGFEEG